MRGSHFMEGSTKLCNKNKHGQANEEKCSEGDWRQISTVKISWTELVQFFVVSLLQKSYISFKFGISEKKRIVGGLEPPRARPWSIFTPSLFETRPEL